MRIPSAIIVLLIAAVSWSSCKKAYDPVDNTVLSQAYLNVVNGTQDTLNFYLHGTRQNTNSNIYPAGATSYLTVEAGQQDYQFKRYLQNTVLFTKPLNLKAPTSDTVYRYSLFIGGETADKTFTTLDTVKSVSDSVRVRFVHTSENAPALDVMLESNKGFKNSTFKSISAFKNFAAGVKTITVYLAGQSAPVATQRTTLGQGSVYTLYVKGVPGGTGKLALTIGISQNQ